jgi:formylglycine-generating enzyme required for sulfatase activity/tRNA A-37 threonylcarbamoyl transferase component Bud32/predicted  nucleic acid-binding Zn-ribbon protein
MRGRKGPYTGQVWGDWEIGGILGEGGMGAVYRAVQHSLKRRVALKVLSPDLAADELLLRRFQQEASISSKLSSPHIVQVYASGEWEGKHFLAMEFVEGTDLYAVLKQRQEAQRPLTPEEAADYLLQAAKGLVEAGTLGIVHRDLKPPNLLITKQGLLKITDFGIVKVIGESTLTARGSAVGTPSYLSPEQGRGEATVDQRSDLYSLGVVFYEILCGRKPFEGDTADTVIYQHCFSEPPLPKSLNPAITDEYQAVLLRCLQKKPENRYQSAAELVKDLDDIRSGNLVKSAILTYNKMATGAAEARRANMSWPQRYLLKLVATTVAALLIGTSAIFYVSHHAELTKTRVHDLHASLMVLDQAVSLPVQVEDRLAELEAGILGHAHHPDIVRWQGKISKVRALSSRLSSRLALLEVGTLTASQRAAAKVDLEELTRAVGTSDPDVMRWSAALAQVQQYEDQLRTALRDAETQPLDLTRRTTLAPLLTKLALMVPDQDPQVLDWQKTISAFDAQLTYVSERLGLLDTMDKISEADRLTFGQLLVRAKPLLGADDERIARWSEVLAQSRARVDHYRFALKDRMAKEDLPSKATQEMIKADLAALRAVVDATDPHLIAWDEQITAANAVYNELRHELAKLDERPKDDTLELALIEPTAVSLARYKALALPGDADLSRWEERVQAARDYLSSLRERLEPLNAEQELTVAQQQALAGAMEQFAAKGALAADTRLRWCKRLEREGERVSARRQELSSFARRAVITPAMRSGLELFARDVGDADHDVQAWRAKLARVDALRAQLAPLEQGHGIPLDCEVTLAQLRELIGDEDAEMVRWTAVAKRLQAAENALRPLDVCQPLPAESAGNLAVMRELAGETNPVYRRRQAKFDRVHQLRGAMDALLDTCAQAPAAIALAHAQFQELLSLVGDTDPALPAWADRLAILDGPGRPLWATAYGRDSFGIWTTAIFAEVTQKFRFVPPGTYLRGSASGEADEMPIHITLTRAFWLAEEECPQGLWMTANASNPSRDRGLRLPVERVSWDEAQAWLAVMRQRHPQHPQLRLPTESEWEYACRAGASGVSEALDQVAWYAGNARGQSEETKVRRPNQLGLYDMLGNVWEWCQDGYGAYVAAHDRDPQGTGNALRVLRGGSWGDPAEVCRPSNRASLKPTVQSTYVGFRLAAEVEWQGQSRAQPTAVAHEGEAPSLPSIRAP